MTIKDITFKNSKGQVLSGIIRYSDPVVPTKYPVIIILHGFAESKHNDLAADLANNLIYPNFLTLRFDFHGHGDSEGEFEEHTIKQQVDDVLAALDFVSDLPYADKDRIAVVGTDIGGNIALLAAAKDARIKALVVQGARSHFEKHLQSWFQPHEFRQLMLRGFHDNQDFKINKEYVTNAREHDILDDIKNVHAPLLLVYGTADMRVKIEEARQLFLAANEPKYMETVVGADHWFRHPYREKFIQLVREWVIRWVK